MKISSCSSFLLSNTSVSIIKPSISAKIFTNKVHCVKEVAWSVIAVCQSVSKVNFSSLSLRKPLNPSLQFITLRRIEHKPSIYSIVVICNDLVQKSFEFIPFSWSKSYFIIVLFNWDWESCQSTHLTPFSITEVNRESRCAICSLSLSSIVVSTCFWHQNSHVISQKLYLCWSGIRSTHFYSLTELLHKDRVNLKFYSRIPVSFITWLNRDSAVAIEIANSISANDLFQIWISEDDLAKLFFIINTWLCHELWGMCILVKIY